MSQAVSTANPPWGIDQPEYSFWSILSSLLAYWKIGMLVFAITCAGAASFYLLAPRVYEATALLAPTHDVGSGGGLRGLGGRIGGIASLAGIDLPDQQGDVDAALAILQGQGFLQQFVMQEGVLPALLAEAGEATPLGGPGTAPDAATLEGGYLKFRNDVLSVSRDRQSGLIEIRVRWTDPQLAAQWCKALVVRINEQMRQSAALEAQKSLDYLNREVDKTPSLEVKQSIYSLIESKVNDLMIANVREDFVFQMLDAPHVPDRSRFVSPSLIVVVAAGILLGGVLAVIFMVAARLIQLRRQPATSVAA
jgi:uncharacterized protein involved in exopolysaccharide biosynthesis